MSEPRDDGNAPWIGTFDIDGVSAFSPTHQTGLIEHYTSIPGRTFLDDGASDGYGSRAVALQGPHVRSSSKGGSNHSRWRRPRETISILQIKMSSNGRHV